MAMSLDGKIATATGQSRYLSSAAARDLVQEWRATYAAVMVGIGTVLADDPSLTCRLAGAHAPLRIVVDPGLQLPPQARLLTEPGPILLATAPDARHEATDALRRRGVETIACPRIPTGGDADAPARAGKLDLRFLLAELARREVSSVLVEGGGGLNATLVGQGLVDRAAFFVAPLLVGGRHAPTPVEGSDIDVLDDAIPLYHLRSRQVGVDLLLEADLAPGDFEQA
jgi:diaminohydroxyphosphoribosylaminopyrimidine deaminase/5-amino-6-(5-phosphoribosylamino)uracil reductase